LTASFGDGVEEEIAAAPVRRNRRPHREHSIRTAHEDLGIVGEVLAAEIPVGSWSDRLRGPVATDLRLLVVEQVTAAQVITSRRLRRTIAAHLGLAVEQQGAAAQKVGDDGLRKSTATQLALLVVSEVPAARDTR